MGAGVCGLFRGDYKNKDCIFQGSFPITGKSHCWHSTDEEGNLYLCIAAIDVVGIGKTDTQKDQVLIDSLR